MGAKRSLVGGDEDGACGFGARSFFDAESDVRLRERLEVVADAGLGTEVEAEAGTCFGEDFGLGVGRSASTSAHSGLPWAKSRKTSGSFDQGPKRRSKVRWSNWPRW